MAQEPPDTQLLWRLLEEAPAAVYVYDPDDRFVYVNRRFEAIFGRPQSEFLGCHPVEVFERPVAEAMVANNAAVRDGERQLFEERVLHGPGGEEHTYATEKWALADGQVAGISIDVTAERRATSALQRRDAILEAIAASAADMISVHELDTGRLMWISDGVRELTGYEPDALVGTTPADWVAYEQPDAMVRHHAEGARAGRPERSVQQITRRDGSSRWVEVHTQPVTVGSGEARTRVSVAITRDVGERHEREAGLRQAADEHRADADLYERMLRTVTDPIVVEDCETGRTVFTNSTMADALTTVTEPTTWREGDLARYAREQLTRSGDSARVEAFFPRRDGPPYPVEILVQGLSHRGRDLAVGIARDMTAQQAARDRIEEALEREHQAVVRLRQVDELRTRMLTSISHEVRTPLTTIHGIAHTLGRRHDLEPSLVDTLLDRLGANTERLDDLLTGLLDLGESSHETDLGVLTSTDVAAQVRNVADRVGLDDDLIRLELHPVTAAVDVAKFRAIVTHLLDNVRRHTPPGTAVVVELAQQGEEVRLTVHDDGPGIPAELHARVFEPFERFTHARQEHSPGAGLGLSLVQLYARLHGGRCELDPEGGGGATFRVVLPTGT